MTDTTADLTPREPAPSLSETTSGGSEMENDLRYALICYDIVALNIGGKKGYSFEAPFFCCGQERHMKMLISWPCFSSSL